MNKTIRHISCLLITAVAMLAHGPMARAGDVSDSHNCITGVAVKNNMLYDLALTPNLGVEVNLHHRWSVSAEGVWAWWSRSSRHRFWRIYGGTVEARGWFGRLSERRILSGHHAGVYASFHTYDFEFGGKGWQSPRVTYGLGVTYGYSWPVNRRLNIDLSASVGYSGGHLTTYRPQCGKYVCLSRGFHKYFGITGLAVTLVWFPGRAGKNNPDR